MYFIVFDCILFTDPPLLSILGGSIGQAIAVTTPKQFTNLSDNYFWSDGLNTSFTQSQFALPSPPYQPSWPVPHYHDLGLICKLPPRLE